MIIPNVFASENLFHGMSSFERLPPAIVPDNSQIIEIKLQYQNGPYSLSDFKPIIDVNPKESAPYVHIEFEPLDDIFLHSVNRIFGIITVDKEIPSKMIFLNISYVGTGINDVQFKSSWSDSIIFDIAPKDLTSTELPSSQDYEFEKLTGARCDGEVALCYGIFYNGTTIPVQCDYRYSCGVIPFDNDVFYQSPLKQLKSGIEPKDVVCKIGLELVIKKSNGEPICIKGTSVKSLTLRGYIPEYNGLFGGETPSDEIVIGIPHALPVEPKQSESENNLTIARELFQEKYDAVVEGTVFWCMGHKESYPIRYQCEIQVDSYIKYDGEKTGQLTVMAYRDNLNEDNQGAIFGLDYHEDEDYYEIMERVLLENED